MPNSYIKATRVVSGQLEQLAREVVLPSLIWRDAGGSFKGAYNDTITLRLPAYTTARTRVMRSASTITVDNLDEVSVNVTLDTHIYKAVGVTDEEMTLDIDNFAEQVSNPVTASVVRGIEDKVASTMAAAPYVNTSGINVADVYPALVDARSTLNKMNVPISNRFLAIGSNVEAALLKSDRLARYDSTGDSGNPALREASVGRIAGFTAVVVPGLDPDWAVAAHKTAFTLALQAPEIPGGAAWGQSTSAGGFALRTLKDYDLTNVRDRFLSDVFAGCNYVTDKGVIDGDGKFQPDAQQSAKLVRAVKMVLNGAS